MTQRLRSPNYPGISLPEAIDQTGKIHQSNRTNAIDREAAALSMGYSGISGKSAKVLSDLVQYGLLEKAGKNGVRVSGRAVEILHPDSPESRQAAMLEAASEPELFRRLRERFPDGIPSEGALRSYLVKDGFTNNAIPAAIRAYLGSWRAVEQEKGYESYGVPARSGPESPPTQYVVQAEPMNARHATLDGPPVPLRLPSPSMAPSAPDFRWVDRQIHLGGVVRTKTQAREAIAFIEAMMAMMRDEEPAPQAPAATAGDPD